MEGRAEQVLHVGSQVQGGGRNFSQIYPAGGSFLLPGGEQVSRQTEASLAPTWASPGMKNTRWG